MKIIGNYEKLEVWKRAHEFALEIYRTTEVFPNEERFGVVYQLRRAAVSTYNVWLKTYSQK